MENEPPTLILWGDSQVGKTTLLATALHSGEQLPFIDRQKSARALSGLFPQFRRLRVGKMTLPTSKDHLDLDLNCTDGGRIRIRDVRGHTIRLTHQDDVARRLEDASVVLFFVEWNARDIEHQMSAIYSAWDLSAGADHGLVFTKCETSLEESDDEVWSAGLNWWEIDPGLEIYRDTLKRFGEALWPTSGFGYDENGLPALVLGEFGEVLPYHIQPYHVHRPFEWAFRQMRARGESR